MKLPMDLTTRMYSVPDRLAKVSSLAFMATSMANFLTSLGSMDNKDIFMNVTALGILVITVTVNVFIQVVQLQSFLKDRLAFPEEILELGFMLILLGMFISSSLMLLPTKRYLETKYHERHKSALKEEQGRMGKVTTDKLRLLVKKYWVMAETSSPQFVIARSITCTSSGAMSLLILFILVEAEVRVIVEYMELGKPKSEYGWSTKWILIVQTIGVIVGTIAPASRWFIAIRFGSLKKGSKSIKNAFIVEGYWTQKMVEWKQSSLSFRIRHLKCRKVVHDTKAQILKFCIFVQTYIVLASKLVLLVSVCIASPIVLFFSYIRRFKNKNLICDSGTSRHREYSETTENSELDIRYYVMLLEGEVELPMENLENICKEVDKVFQKGIFQKPKNLFKFLYKSCNFNGVIEFDSYQVPSLHFKELPYCWSLPVVTLTGIALALPNIEKTKSTMLLNSVTEGLPFVKRIDKSLDRKGHLVNIRKAADFVWVRVELYHKWQDKDLHESSLKGINSKEVLQELSAQAETTILEFKKNVKDCLARNPLHWPTNIIAANSMYRISNTILLDFDSERENTDGRLFERISTMIADIMSASLTNLVNVITMRCHQSAIEKRESSVYKAALLLGETEEIMALLQQRELPSLVPGQVADIEEWRILLEGKKKNHKHNINMQASRTRNEQVTIKVEKSRWCSWKELKHGQNTV